MSPEKNTEWMNVGSRTKDTALRALGIKRHYRTTTTEALLV